MCCDATTIARELWLFQDIVRLAFGASLEAIDTTLSLREQLASSDLILLGPYGSRAVCDDFVRSSRGVSIFLGSENTDGGPFDDQMLGVVDVSLGHRRQMSDFAEKSSPWLSFMEVQTVHSRYLRIPWWLPYSVDPTSGGCAFSSSLLQTSLNSSEGSVVASAWRMRPGFSSLVSSHAPYPRKELFSLLRRVGRVDAPGAAFHNMEWPEDIPGNTHLDGKLTFLSRYRFNICPENSRTRGSGGYTTEKLTQALMAGSIPIYWGDSIDEEVFNPARVIIFDGYNEESVVSTVLKLENDQDFRINWFSQPILAPSAPRWLQAWCHSAANILREATTD